MSEAPPTVCLNCGSPLRGPFCAACGQRDVPPYPSVRELAIDAISEFSGWDGRLSQTLRMLIRRPGVLTREFLEGRRARYISPLRVYLTASLVYFVVAAAAPDVRLEDGKTLFLGLRVGATAKDDPNPLSRPQRVGASASRALETGNALNAAEKAAALEDIARAPAVMQPFLRRAVEDPGGFKRRILETMPRMLFVLLPIFAGILALFYRGRKYPEHLYFAIHLHAFIFLALGVSELLKFTQSVPLVSVMSLITSIWIPIYATLAFRRVYGGSLARTLAKELAIGTIYALVAAVGFITMIYWVSVAT
jgi:hypothetical protein